MLFRLLTISFLLFSGILSAQGRLLSRERLTTITTSQFDSLVELTGSPKSLVSIRYDVDVYRVIYTTAWHDGSEIKASGFYFVPKASREPLARLSYNHGTRLQKNGEFKFSGEEAICAFFATDGYAVTMPDYVGLGSGERQHLYHHAETEALANINLLRAVEDINQELELEITEHLFLTGYSQGGHAALCTHQYIQEHLAGEFTVTASAPMSGAYDLAGVQAEVMYKPYETPGYLPYLLYSMQEVYGLIPDDQSFFIPPYDTLLPPMFLGKNSLKEVNTHLPDVPGSIVRPELITMMKEQPDNRVQKALEANSPLDWAPEAPVLLCYCKGDEQVKYENAGVAKKRMEANGAEHIKTLKVGGKKFRHGPCALYASIYGKLWFDSLREGHKKGKFGTAGQRFLLRMGRMTYKRPKKK
jgi:acetyl esterase/lipase